MSPHALAHFCSFSEWHKVPIEVRVAYSTIWIEPLRCREDSRIEQDIMGRHADRCLYKRHLGKSSYAADQGAAPNTYLLSVISPNHRYLSSSSVVNGSLEVTTAEIHSTSLTTSICSTLNILEAGHHGPGHSRLTIQGTSSRTIVCGIFATVGIIFLTFSLKRCSTKGLSNR